MKKYIIIFFTVALSVNGCYKEINVSPNSPSSVPLPTLLSSIEVTSSYNMGADASHMTNMFTQHVAGLSTQPQAWDKYNVDAEAGNFFDNMYTNSLKDLTILISQAQNQKLTVYEGIGKVLMANSLGVLTDMYGDIPFSQGLNGEVTQYPSYDRQEDVYINIQRLLDEAISALKQPNTAGILPGNDDLIYKGSATKWLAAAYSLKARYSIHLSKINSTKAGQDALAALYEGANYRGVPSNADDMDLVFGTVVNQAHPWYHWVLVRNDFRLGKVFVDLLNRGAGDPRRRFFAKANTAGAYVGSVAGNADANTSQLGDYYNRPNAPVTLMSYAETKFIEAEARIRVNINDPLAQRALTDAITASINKVTGGTATTAEINAVIAGFGTLAGTFEQQLATIINQKYIALFTQPEAWVDWRRTGYPMLTASVGGVNGLNPTGDIPRRLPVPLSERVNNPNAPKVAPNLQTPRLFWDK
jgi:hypothetical protein